MTSPDPIIAQIDECLELAKRARSTGDDVVFIASLALASDLIRVRKALRPIGEEKAG